MKKLYQYESQVDFIHICSNSFCARYVQFHYFVNETNCRFVCLFNFAQHRHVYSFPSVCGKKNFPGDSGGIRTHDLLLISADVLTSRPPSLPNDDWLARILDNNGFRDVYRYSAIFVCPSVARELNKIQFPI